MLAGLPDVVRSGPLAYLVEQLWVPVLAQPGVRLALGKERSGARTLEEYVVLPTPARATMLVPAGPPRATSGALLNYRGLRRRLPNAQRAVLGSLTRFGQVPAVHLRLLHEGPGEPPVTPLAAASSALSRSGLGASLGIRTGSNRKSTLNLVDRAGAPVGFAKFAWEEVSATSVAWEAAALEDVGGRAGAARAPRLIASTSYYGQPFLVSDPLPIESRGVRADVPPPSALELYGLLPLGRRCTAAQTRQFAAVRTRLRALDGAPQQVTRVAGAAAVLMDRLEEQRVEIVAQSRWHGDLSPWNAARDREGTLWLWDWESSETDAVAGMDAVHWHMSRLTETGRAWDGAGLRSALVAARPLIAAAGMTTRAECAVTAAYTATIVERACTLAAAGGGWEDGWLSPAGAHELVATAQQLLHESPRG